MNYAKRIRVIDTRTDAELVADYKMMAVDCYKTMCELERRGISTDVTGYSNGDVVVTCERVTKEPL